ncbi:response regulator GacA [Pseudomonas aeruginosa]|nr:response regulator GacA [Pseudomonas aeruginosa]
MVVDHQHLNHAAPRRALADNRPHGSPGDFGNLNRKPSHDLAWRKGVINQASWKHHSTASNGRCEVYRQPPASGRPDRSKNRRTRGEPSEAGLGKAQAPSPPGTSP